MTDDQRYFWGITLATCTNSYHKILMPHEFLLDYFNYFNFAICSRPIDHESVIYLTLKKHVWFLFRSLQLDWYKCCFERKENVEGTDAFCLMIGYEFFLDTVVTLTFFQCFIFLAAFSSWPRSFIICQKKSEMWVSTGLFEIQQVKSTKKWNNITLIHM